MIRVTRFRWRGMMRNESATMTEAVCDTCGTAGAREHGDTHFDRGLAVAAAKSAGFQEYLDGRISKLRCGPCRGPLQLSLGIKL